MTELRIFIAESASDLDFYRGRIDGHAANEVLKIRGVTTTYRMTISYSMLKQAIEDATEQEYNVFHLSCHGNDDGFRLCDGEDIGWLELAEMLQPFAGSGRLLVNSSCQGGHIRAAKAFAKSPMRFDYILGSTSEEGVTFSDSCIAWSILYNEMANEGTVTVAAMRRAIDKMNMVVPGDFVYRKWEKERYRVYPRP